MARPFRYGLIPLGAALVVTPFLFAASVAHVAASVLIGVMLIALSFQRGAMKERYGTWDRRIV